MRNAWEARSVVLHYAAYTLLTRIAPPFLYYNASDCKTTLRDKKVNIQAPCGGTRDFRRFQHSPLLQCRLHFLYYSPVSRSLCCRVTLWRKYMYASDM